MGWAAVWVGGRVNLLLGDGHVISGGPTAAGVELLRLTRGRDADIQTQSMH